MTTILLMAGGTASGKTTIATELAKRRNAVLIHHDRYYKDIVHPRGYNFDEPDALESDLLTEHIRLLKDGKPASLPVYDFSTHSRTSETEVVYPAPLIIVEGILVMSVPALRALSDLCVFVDAPSDIRLIRRIRRDVLERGRDVEGVLEQYISTVRPMHERHIAPCIDHASILLDGTVAIEKSVSILENRLILQ
jgi:uridine kinase